MHRNDTLHILMLNHNVIGSGTFHRCFYLGQLMVKQGHQVTIVTNSAKSIHSFNSYQCNSVHIIETPDIFFGQLRSGWDPINAWRRSHFLQSFDAFDVVHAFDCRPTVIYPALQLRELWRCPLIMDWCDWWGRGGAITLREPRWLNKLFEPIETFFEEHFRTTADHVTTISEPLRQRAIGLGVKEENVTVIPPIADLEGMFPESKVEARQKFAIPQDASVLIFSSFVKYDINFLQKAMGKVFAKVQNILLLVTGGRHKALLKMAKRLPVKCVGHVSKEDLRSYIASSDICLLPLSNTLANQVRYPDKLRTYLSCGRPVVTTKVGEAARLLEGQNVGTVTEPCAMAFAEGILWAINQPNKFEVWGGNARRLAETELSARGYHELLEQIYLKKLDRFEQVYAD